MTLNRLNEIKNRPVRNGPCEAMLVDELAAALEAEMDFLVKVRRQAGADGLMAQQAGDTWPEGSLQRELHKGRAQACQEIVTFIESHAAK